MSDDFQPGGGPWSRLFPVIYDPFLWLGERAGMRRRRSALLAGARGRVLEIGAGTGLNLPHYPSTIDGLVATEPNEGMASRLRARVARAGVDAEVVVAGAEAMPFADASFDTVVSTLVLCTVPDQQAAVDEIARVLRPGGRLLFIEHVRAESGTLGSAQDRLMRPWRVIGDGCVCNRRTLELLERSPLRTEGVERHTWKFMPPIVRPLVIGSAVAG